MPEPLQPKAEASSVAWRWRDRAAGDAAARLREAAANRRKGAAGGLIGLTVAAVLFFGFHRPVMAGAVAGIAVLIALLALASPLGLYKGLTRALDAFAHGLGMTVTWVAMPILFYLVFLPVGLVLRARGKLAISKGADPRQTSYWKSTDRERTLESYRKQF